MESHYMILRTSIKNLARGALDDVVMGEVSQSTLQIDPTGGEDGGPAGIFKGIADTSNCGALLVWRFPCCRNCEYIEWRGISGLAFSLLQGLRIIERRRIVCLAFSVLQVTVFYRNREYIERLRIIGLTFSFCRSLSNKIFHLYWPTMGFLSWLLTIVYIFTYLKIPSNTNFSKYNMTACQSLNNGQTMVSPNQRFELGFFSLSHQQNKGYLGIWYKGIEPLTVVWVANPKKVLQISKARLQLGCNGALSLFDHRHSPIFIYNPTKNVSKPYLQILDSGNLVIAVNFTEVPLWQSFDYPSDTLLSSMSLGWSHEPQKSFVLTSWKDADNPSPGDFTLGLDNPQFPQLLLLKKSIKLSRWSPYIGDRFSVSGLLGNSSFLSARDEHRIKFIVWNETELIRLQLTQFGKIRFLSWNLTSKKWVPVMYNSHFCDDYNACGPYGICHNEKPNCRCLNGFVPSNYQNPHPEAGAGGCKRNISQKFDVRDDFKNFRGLKLPDNAVVRPNLNSSQCGKKCLEKYNCNAYSYIDVHENGTSNCVVWLDDLLDMGDMPNGGNDLNIRMARAKSGPVQPAPIPPSKIAASQSPSQIPPSKKGKKMIIFFIILSSVFVVGFSVLLFKRCSRMRTARRLDQQRLIQRIRISKEEEIMDFRLFEIDVISKATNDFSFDNKIGEGGFGPVYKGVLQNGQEIAVKRLCSSSRQGQEQFENESGLIAKLRHRNLVKLVGCCVHEAERMLVYEYLSNKSLEKFIFDPARKMLLSWFTRSDIIIGIAKGLAYLHGDSGMNIVHRDLKASNILLDSNMKPKISDFGMATILGDDNELNVGTSKVTGTCGYIAPEYQMKGLFSTKSDVFSFGVLVLEIVSGRRNHRFELDDDTSLLGHAWDLWREGDPMEMMDKSLGEQICKTKFVRLVQIGLLCAQQNPEHRPTMSNVVCMLMNETMPLPELTVPGFLSNNPSLNGIVRPLSGSFNGLTITGINAR